MRHIKGFDRAQSLLLPELIDDYVCEDNPVRFLDAFVNNLDLAALEFTHAIPKRTGRPAYSPYDLLKLYLYGYLNQIFSSRQLEQATHRNLELIWLMRKLQPDFKTIADFRAQNSAAIRKVCGHFVLLCKEQNLFGCELIAIDGSKFKAVNSKQRNFTKKTTQMLLKKIDNQIVTYLQELEKTDQLEAGVNRPDKKALQNKIDSLKHHKKKLEQIAHDLTTSGQNQVSLTDPDSRRMPTRTGAEISYNVQIATDDKHKLIVAHEVTNAVTDANQLSAMARKSKQALGAETLNVVTDMGYYNSEEIKACDDQNITCFMPKPVKSNYHDKGLFTKDDFQYDAERDMYLCPAGQDLTHRYTITKHGRQVKIYKSKHCKRCAFRDQCTRSIKGRSRIIPRWIHEQILEQLHQRSAANPDILKRRKALVEHPFGIFKRWMGQSHFLTRGLENVGTEMALMVTAYNLKRTINLIGVKKLMAAVA